MLSSVLLDNSRLEATMDRRTFIRLVAGSAACSFVGGAVPAGAEELDDNFTPFSPELAAEMASAFFEGAGGLSSCVCSEPIPLFDSSGQLQGYEVTATDYSDCPLGYVVFDVRCPGIVSRFSFAEGKPGPYEQIVGNDVSAYSLATDQPMLVSSSPLDFSVPLFSRGVSLLAGGEVVDLSDVAATYSDDGSSSYDPTSWNELMIRWTEVLRGPYTLKEHNNIEVNGLSQAESVDALGRYACAVTALYSMASTMLNAAGNDWLINRRNDIGCYNTIWEYTNTTVDHVKDGVTYGSTQHQDIGPGFQRFCAERGVSILPVRVVSPSLQKFKNKVDALRQSVVMLAINEGTASAPKRAGHAMAVSGYGRITRGLTSLNCIVVHDGWSDEAFINYDFQGFMDKNGVFM